MRTLCRYHVLLLLLCARAEAHPGAQPGESFTFKFSVGSIESGRARMSVGLPADQSGRRLIAVHGQAETLPWLALVARMNDDYQLVVDADTLLPVEVVSIERGLRERRIDTAIRGRVADLRLESKKESKKLRRALPDVARDPLSALFAVRAAELKDGDTVELLIIDGLVLWHTRMTVKRELLRLSDEAPSRRAIRLDGENQRLDGGPPKVRRHFIVWLADDADRALLRMEADTELGRAALQLTSYHGPARRAATPSLPGMKIAR